MLYLNELHCSKRIALYSKVIEPFSKRTTFRSRSLVEVKCHYKVFSFSYIHFSIFINDNIAAKLYAIQFNLLVCH